MLSFDTILQTEDILNEITLFLSFEDKILFGKYCKKNLVKYYDFSKYNKKHISELFGIFKNDEYIDYVHGDLCSEFTSDLTNSYDEYFGYDIEDFMNDFYNNIPIERYRYLSDLFRSSYADVYTKKLIEYVEKYIENKKILIKYDYDEEVFELENKLNVDIHEMVIEYYKEVFENEEIEIFCNRCGLFGHHNASKKCIFYDKSFENKETKKEVKTIMKNIIDKIIDKSKEEENRKKREPLLCHCCKNNNKLAKCIHKYCALCCNDENCIHSRLNNTKMLKSNPLCASCSKNKKHNKCKNYSCRSCCKDKECKTHYVYVNFDD